MKRALALLLLASCVDDRAAAQRYVDAWCAQFDGGSAACPRNGGGAGGGSGGGGGGGVGGGSTGGGGGGGSGGSSTADLLVRLELPDAGVLANRCEPARVETKARDGGRAELSQPVSVSYAFVNAAALHPAAGCGTTLAGSFDLVDGGLDVWLSSNVIGSNGIHFTADGADVGSTLFESLAYARVALVSSGSACFDLTVLTYYWDGTKVQQASSFGSGAGDFRLLDAQTGNPELFFGGSGCSGGTVSSGTLAPAAQYSIGTTPDQHLLVGAGVRPVLLYLGTLAGTDDAGMPCDAGLTCASRQCRDGRCECMPPGGACGRAGVCCSNLCSGGVCG